MKVIVTGAGGYIGCVLVEELLKARHDVIVIDKFLFGKNLIKPNGYLRRLQYDVRDINENSFARLGLVGADAIIDLAAISNDPAGEFFAKETDEINWHARSNLAKVAKYHGIKRYLLPSSCSIYGCNDNQVDEKSPINPLTTYAKANGKAEEEILPLADDNFCVTVLRQSTVFGYSPRMRLDLAINIMTYEAVKNHKIIIHGDGMQWRPFIHVRDTSRAMIKILESDTKLVNGEIFNVGVENITIKDLAYKIKNTLNHLKIEIEFQGYTDNRNYNVNFEKIKNALNWQPLYDITLGIQEIYAKIDEIEGTDKNITLKWYQNLETYNKYLNEIHNGNMSVLKRV